MGFVDNNNNKKKEYQSFYYINSIKYKMHQTFDTVFNPKAAALLLFHLRKILERFPLAVSAIWKHESSL